MVQSRLAETKLKPVAYLDLTYTYTYTYICTYIYYISIYGSVYMRARARARARVCVCVCVCVCIYINIYDWFRRGWNRTQLTWNEKKRKKHVQTVIFTKIRKNWQSYFIVIFFLKQKIAILIGLTLILFLLHSIYIIILFSY